MPCSLAVPTVITSTGSLSEPNIEILLAFSYIGDNVPVGSSSSVKDFLITFGKSKTSEPATPSLTSSVSSTSLGTLFILLPYKLIQVKPKTSSCVLDSLFQLSAG